MKHLCFSKILFLLIFVAAPLSASFAHKSALVYYGDTLSYPMAGVHDYIIVEPAHTNVYTHGFSVYKEKIYAYLSVVEQEKRREDLDPQWIVGENKEWNSALCDIANESYQEYLLERLSNLKKSGFENFFFDTMDSYMLYAKDTTQKEKYQQALIAFLQKVNRRFPEAKIVLNRGFELLESVHTIIEAVLFESYHYRLANNKEEYEKVSQEEKAWLDGHIEKIKSYGIDIIALDYLPMEEKEKIEETKEIILARGMIPYISVKELDIYGVSSKDAHPREVLMLIDEKNKDRLLQGAHQYGSLPLEYYGYIPRLHDINQGLPKPSKMAQYAGVVIWLETLTKDTQTLIEWLKGVKQRGIKIVFVNNFGFVPKKGDLDFLDIKIHNRVNGPHKTSHILSKDKMMGFEIKPSDVSFKTTYLQPYDAKELLVYMDDAKEKNVQAAITSWGGYIMDGSSFVEIQNETLWIVDPFAFFKEALDLKQIPVADVTTQNGRRVFFSHVDGDGIMNQAEFNPKLLSGDVILEEILKKYKLPHSVSVIGAEINPEGVYPQLSERLIDIVKQMYALENVEAATHTYTHPFYWDEIINENLSEAYRLEVKGYTFSFEREFLGSLEQINNELLPKSKEPSRTVFWSGSCNPKEDVLEFISKHQLLNINGGDTIITNSSPWISLVAPLGLQRGEYYQIYTGAQNENVYTNDWTGPFWGFKKVVQTFMLTEKPRRLKPINIYYHPYAGSKIASLNALKYVFDWAMKQDIFPIYTSRYIPIVMDFMSISLAKEEDVWLIAGAKYLKTLRYDKEMGAVSFKDSLGILGYKQEEGKTYIHLDEGTIHKLKVVDKKQAEHIYLRDANGWVKKEGNRYILHGHLPLKTSWYVPDGCALQAKNAKISKNGETVEIDFRDTKGILDATCQ